MSCDLVIENAEVIAWSNGLTRVKANVGVSEGKISEISSSSLRGKHKINAHGLTVLPGVIDSQVHFREPGLTHKEDLDSGTRGAALGGVTSVFEMPNTNPATTSLERLQEKFSLAKDRCWTNYAFFVGASPENYASLPHLESLPGVSGVKVFMGSSTGSLLIPDDQSLLNVLNSGKRRVIIHSEDEERLRERKHLAIESGDVHTHPIWRDVESAVKSTKRLLRLAEKSGRPVHVLHVTTKEEAELLAQYKSISTMEVTPQHLTLFAPDCYDRLGTLAQMNPPIREKIHQDALWKALQQGVVDVIGSDHAPHTREEKQLPYPQSPSGMPGVQTLLPVMLNHVHQGRLSLERLVELVGEGPRRVFGCQQKGRIAVGLDADFTLVDIHRRRTIENKWIASRCGWTPFDGMQVTGWPVYTIVGGHIVMKEDVLLDGPKGQPVLFN